MNNPLLSSGKIVSLSFTDTSSLGHIGGLTSASAWSCKRQTDREGTEWDGTLIDLVQERAD